VREGVRLSVATADAEDLLEAGLPGLHGRRVEQQLLHNQQPLCEGAAMAPVASQQAEFKRALQAGSSTRAASRSL